MTAPHATHAGVGLRLIRAAVFTAVCVVLSATGHVLASCASVPWWSLCLGFLAVFTVAVPLAGRRRNLPGIAAGLAAGQLSLHALFGLGQHSAAAAQAPVQPSDSSLAALAAKLVCGGNTVPLSPDDARRVLESAGLDPASLARQAAQAGQLADRAHGAHAHLADATAAAPATGLLSPAMLLGHLLAALAAGWLLGRGDAALLRLAELSRVSAEAAPVRPLRTALAYVRALCAGLPGAPARAPRTPPADADRSPTSGGEPLQHSVIRRGPPTALALAA
ncbi:hypothetical protein ACFWUQ_00830 [Streptomyces sp. NPDC058662]|uniref:hypothetical protein n=1 Tax=Streptomyces sp. NPDC058662 TaxID=3346583 RepID=UPI00364B8F41